MAPDRSHRLLCLLASAQLSPLTTFGTKLFEVTDLRVVATNCKLTVKDTGDLLLLRDWIFEELGPPYMWIIMLSVVEWDTFTTEQKELHSMIHASWFSSYRRASHTVLQLALAVPQEKDPGFRTSPQSVCKNQ